MAEKSILAQYDEPKNQLRCSFCGRTEKQVNFKKDATQLEKDVHDLSVHVHIMLWIMLVASIFALVAGILMIITTAHLGAIAENTNKKSSSSSSYSL